MIEGSDIVLPRGGAPRVWASLRYSLKSAWDRNVHETERVMRCIDHLDQKFLDNKLPTWTKSRTTAGGIWLGLQFGVAAYGINKLPEYAFGFMTTRMVHLLQRMPQTSFMRMMVAIISSTSACQYGFNDDVEGRDMSLMNAFRATILTAIPEDRTYIRTAVALACASVGFGLIARRAISNPNQSIAPALPAISVAAGSIADTLPQGWIQTAYAVRSIAHVCNIGYDIDENVSNYGGIATNVMILYAIQKNWREYRKNKNIQEQPPSPTLEKD